MALPAGTPALQQAVSAWSKRVHTAGWVANHDGNLSVRMSDGERFLATPTATSKRSVEPHDVITVDLDGKRLSGRKRLFSEWHLHAACYRARPDVRCVIHAHPPATTAIGLAGREIGAPTLPEMVVTLGTSIPTLPYAFPKSAAQDDAVARALTDGDADVLLLSRNGALSVGADLEQAYLRLELVEHYAKILLHTWPLGGPAPLPAADVEKLLAARTKAGLGRAGRASR